MYCIVRDLVPSITMATALPSRPSLSIEEDMNNFEGFGSSTRPLFVMENMPTSEADPNLKEIDSFKKFNKFDMICYKEYMTSQYYLRYLFFILRTKRYSACSMPSTYSTTSTMCSRTRGPATSPDLVTCPTRITNEMNSVS